jgi:hypothetical protein
MNRLFSKLKDFGLIFFVNPENEEEVISQSKALKKADLPVILFPFHSALTLNPVKISNDNEDMFIGSLCEPDLDEIKKATAAGSHFIICNEVKGTIISECRSMGIDLIVMIKTEQELQTALKNGSEAVLIKTETTDSEHLCRFLLEKTDLTLFVMGKGETLPFNQLRNRPDFAAFIVEDSNDSFRDIYSESHKWLRQMLGLRFTGLSLKSDSLKIEDARVFSALAAIPLILNAEKDLLTVEVKDMDRTIAYLKWKEIYMNPISTKMRGSKILETELFSDFLGWPVKLVSPS